MNNTESPRQCRYKKRVTTVVLLLWIIVGFVIIPLFECLTGYNATLVEHVLSKHSSLSPEAIGRAYMLSFCLYIVVLAGGARILLRVLLGPAMRRQKAQGSGTEH